MLNKLYGNIDIYKKAMDASWLKNTAISNNLANVNTPGYKRQNVKFDSILKDYITNSSIQLNKTHPKHISNNDISLLEPKITREMGTSFRKDKNNVNVDVEMAELSKNYIQFNLLARQLSGQISKIKMCISKGGK
ncbi:flagellar basal body rod protein FlgB [Paramaledivibacter caminithermalis]|uniref:Flagellar basal body rod protein FlgB n=1 Tax=Paramaledivibacter caminithermalis (strain DSM 15212 / CIP 107654 / DViRD3) TaxID=1121301 RepID=A0A1M6N850_PARC5|nr:flagellar basal body rod protein FlgB [Paramaledivibacter caminithermalis]SHJ91920.1 flagellar basal-body rod protein FlgB [Paramaledivibacter caminithermalis DSM 15212]